MKRVLLGMMLGVLTVTGFLRAEDWKPVTSTVEKQSHVNQKLYSGIKSQEEWDKALQKAFDQNDASAVRFLIELQKKNDFDFEPTPLFQSAVRGRRTEVAVALLEAEVEIEKEDANGDRPVFVAISSGNEKLASLLVQKGAALDFKVKGESLEDWIFKTDSLVGLKLLHPKLGRDTSSALLEKAVQFSSKKLLAALLEAGANPWVGVDKASSLSNVHALEAFLKRDPTLVYQRHLQTGKSLLFRALEVQDFKSADLLLKRQPRIYKEESAEILAVLKDAREKSDAQMAAQIKKYEGIVKTRTVSSPAPKNIQKAIDAGDVKTLKSFVANAPDDKLWELTSGFINNNEVELARTLAVARPDFIQKQCKNVFRWNRYSHKSWPLFEALHSSQGDRSCIQDPELIAHIINTDDSALLERIMKLDPPLNLNAISGRGAVGDGNFYSYARDHFKKLGVLGYAQQYDVLKELRKSLKDGAGESMLKTYSARTLGGILNGQAFREAALFGDGKLAQAMAQTKMVPKEVVATYLPFTDPVNLSKAKLVCVNLINELPDPEARKRLFKHFMTQQFSFCSDLDNVLLTMASEFYGFGFEGLAESVFNSSTSRARLNQVRDAKHGNSLLHLAVSSCQTELVKRLIAAGVDPKALNNKAETPLYLAIRPASECPSSSVVETMRILAEAGVDLNLPLAGGITPLRKAFKANASDAFEVLLAAGADVEQTPSTIEGLTFAEEITLESQKGSGNDVFVDALVSHGIRPLKERNCTTWSHPAFEGINEGPVLGMNRALLKYLRRQTEHDKKEDCEAITKRANLEYFQNAIAFHASVEKFKKLGIELRQNVDNKSDVSPYDSFKKIGATNIGSNDWHSSYRAKKGYRTLCCGMSFDNKQCRERAACNRPSPPHLDDAALCRLAATQPGFSDSTVKLSFETLDSNEDGSSLTISLEYRVDPGSGSLEPLRYILASVPLGNPADNYDGRKALLKYPHLEKELKHKDLKRRLAASKTLVEKIFEHSDLMSHLGFDTLQNYVAKRYPQCAQNFRGDKTTISDALLKKTPATPAATRSTKPAPSAQKVH